MPSVSPEVRRGGPGDLAAIAVIQAASPEGSQWPVADYLAGELRVAVVEGRVAGFLAGRVILPGESEILNLAVSPANRRAGVGKTLVAGWIREFPGTVFLEVRESNSGARTLYQVLGFKEVGSRPGYYENPPERAIVLKFHSC
jgi:ribosomal protein S18 acetylase RimI-like enzyme